jgi:hypothetical protein
MATGVSIGADASVHAAAVAAALAQIDIAASLRAEEELNGLFMAAPGMIRCFTNHGAMT